MKIERQEPAFQPITIIVENEHDARALLAAVAAVVSESRPGSPEFHLAADIRAWLHANLKP